MKLTIYLGDEVAYLLKCFGPLDTVVNKILEAGAEGLFDIMDKPNIAEKNGGRYYSINVVEPNYIMMLETFGTRSSKISLRRLLYWFVDNEIYSELGWELVSTPIDEKAIKSYKTFTDLKNIVYKCSKEYSEHSSYFEQINEILKKIEEEIWNA